MFCEERECQPNKTMNIMMKLDQSKPRRSKDGVEVSLLIFLLLSLSLLAQFFAS